jgi:ribonuclease BN (tRNA processing enzyme)
MLDASVYVVVRRYAPDGPYPRVPVFGPSGVRERLTAVYGSPHEGPLEDVYAFRTLEPGEFTIGPFRVTAERVNHPVETFGFRLEHRGRTLAYSADTAPCDALIRLAHRADVFLCEASYLDGEANPPDIHLTGREAGEAAAKADVGRLLLTHLVEAWGDPAVTYEAAVAVFPGPVDRVRPGDQYEI